MIYYENYRNASDNIFDILSFRMGDGERLFEGALYNRSDFTSNA